MSDTESLYPSKKARTITNEPKSVELDLEVVVGKDSDDGKQQCKSRWYSSAVLATFSGYVDTMMASSMRESRSKRITFPDITIETWDLMMKFLFHPVECAKMSLERALELAMLYDKYEFRQGKCLCDQVLSTHLDKGFKGLEMDMFVTIVGVSFEANLDESCGSVKNSVEKILSGNQPGMHPCMLETKHVQQLIPLFMDLLKSDPQIKILPHHPVTNNDIQSPLFPILFAEAWKSSVYKRCCHDQISSLFLEGTGLRNLTYFEKMENDEEADKFIFRCNYVTIRDAYCTCFIGVRGVDWEIYYQANDDNTEQNFVALWTAPGTGHLPLPPKKGWESVHSAAIGTPKIKFVLYD